jgi:hypothetical protein
MAADPRVIRQLTARVVRNQRRGCWLASRVAELARLTAETETDLAEAFDNLAASGSRRGDHLRTLAADARRYAVHERDEAERWGLAPRGGRWTANPV